MKKNNINNLQFHLPNFIDITFYALVESYNFDSSFKYCLRTGKVKSIEESYMNLSQSYQKLENKEFIYADLNTDTKEKIETYLLKNKSDIISWITSSDKFIPSSIYDIYLETLSSKLTVVETLLFKNGSEKNAQYKKQL